MKKDIHHIFAKLVQYLHIQLFLSLIALPILIMWGLPYSPLCILGNILFAPILTLFLIGSIAIFFFQLLGISPFIPIHALEWLSWMWITAMKYGQNSLLFGFPAFNAPGALVIAIGAIIVIQYKVVRKNSMTLLTTLIAFHALIHIAAHFNRIQTIYSRIPCTAKTFLHLIHINGQTIVIDPGYLIGHVTPVKIFCYKIIPEIIKQTGKTCIDHFIILNINRNIEAIVPQLQECIAIKTIYFSQSLPDKQALKEDPQVVNIDKYPIIIMLNEYDHLTIYPLPTYISYRTTSLSAVKVTGLIDKNPVNFYSAKYRVNRTRKENYDR